MDSSPATLRTGLATEHALACSVRLPSSFLNRVSPHRTSGTVRRHECAPLAELEPLCRQGLLKVERAIAHHDEVPPSEHGCSPEVRRLIDSIALAGDAVRQGQADIAKREAQSSELKRNFGRALDELGTISRAQNALVPTSTSASPGPKTARRRALRAGGASADAWLWSKGLSPKM